MSDYALTQEDTPANVTDVQMHVQMHPVNADTIEWWATRIIHHWVIFRPPLR